MQRTNDTNPAHNVPSPGAMTRRPPQRRLFVVATTALALLWLPAAAHAQTPTVTGAPELKSPAAAVLMSLTTTAALTAGGIALGAAGSEQAGFGLFALGVVVAPSLGHFYAGEWGHGLITSGLRLGLGTATLVTAVSSMFAHERDESGANGAAAVGLGIATVGLMLYDIIDAPLAAKRTNKKRQRAWLLAPTLARHGDALQPGLSMVGRF